VAQSQGGGGGVEYSFLAYENVLFNFYTNVFHNTLVYVAFSGSSLADDCIESNLPLERFILHYILYIHDVLFATTSSLKRSTSLAEPKHSAVR